MYAKHEESTGLVATSPEALFAVLDDHMRLSAHMNQRSWKMGWGKMDTILDAERGQAVGSRIILRGRVLGIWLSLEETVTERKPPCTKSWETVGEPRLLVIGSYRMGFTIMPEGRQTRLRVYIDYNHPSRGFARLLGALFGDWYARWCTARMVADAREATTSESRVEVCDADADTAVTLAP